MPKSMCSWMPKPKLPLWEKFSFLSSYSFTLKPLSRISSACIVKISYAFGKSLLTSHVLFVSWPFMFNHLNQAKDGDKNNHHKKITTKQFHQITLGPLTVQWTEIFSFLLIPKLRTV